MTIDTYIKGMASASRRFAKLFEDPQPGLWTWHMSCIKAMEEILELWDKPQEGD